MRSPRWQLKIPWYKSSFLNINRKLLLQEAINTLWDHVHNTLKTHTHSHSTSVRTVKQGLRALNEMEVELKVEIGC